MGVRSVNQVPLIGDYPGHLILENKFSTPSDVHPVLVTLFLNK